MSESPRRRRIPRVVLVVVIALCLAVPGAVYLVKAQQRAHDREPYRSELSVLAPKVADLVRRESLVTRLPAQAPDVATIDTLARDATVTRDEDGFTVALGWQAVDLVFDGDGDGVVEPGEKLGVSEVRDVDGLRQQFSRGNRPARTPAGEMTMPTTTYQSLDEMAAAAADLVRNESLTSNRAPKSPDQMTLFRSGINAVVARTADGFTLTDNGDEVVEVLDGNGDGRVDVGERPGAPSGAPFAASP